MSFSFAFKLFNTSFKRANKQNHIYKVNSDNKILSFVIKKAHCKCTFLNHVKEENGQ